MNDRLRLRRRAVPLAAAASCCARAAAAPRARRGQRRAHWSTQIFQGYGGDWGDFDRGTVERRPLAERIARAHRPGAPTRCAASSTRVPARAAADRRHGGAAARAARRRPPLYFLSNMPEPYAAAPGARRTTSSACSATACSRRASRLMQARAGDLRAARARASASTPAHTLFIDDRGAQRRGGARRRLAGAAVRRARRSARPSWRRAAGFRQSPRTPAAVAPHGELGPLGSGRRGPSRGRRCPLDAWLCATRSAAPDWSAAAQRALLTRRGWSDRQRPRSGVLASARTPVRGSAQGEPAWHGRRAAQAGLPRRPAGSGPAPRPAAPPRSACSTTRCFHAVGVGVERVAHAALDRRALRARRPRGGSPATGRRAARRSTSMHRHGAVLERDAGVLGLRAFLVGGASTSGRSAAPRLELPS